MSATYSCSSVSSDKLIIRKVKSYDINGSKALAMEKTDPSTKADKLLQDAENALNQTLALTEDCLGEKIESTVDDLLNNSHELNEVLSTGPGSFDSNQIWKT